MGSVININCSWCKNLVQKQKKEYTRQLKKGNKNFFCNLSCSCKYQNSIKSNFNSAQNLISDNRKDEFTPFRYFVKMAKYRSQKLKRYSYDVTVEYLKELWDEQKGICPFTNQKMILPFNSSFPWEVKSPINASLDRIDNSKGYIKGNVRFISFMANMCRNTFTDQDVIDFCKKVTNFNNIK